MITNSVLQLQHRVTYTDLQPGDKFHIVNINFTPAKVMSTEFTKISEMTYSYERPYRPCVIDSLSNPEDNFQVVLVTW